mmetsp:Transcript_336/g.1217  ORF Transcript_336/g.1217 Transcript_336/m.1217 type:complete len:85 (+) Transcript_336:1359-1613(+)
MPSDEDNAAHNTFPGKEYSPACDASLRFHALTLQELRFQLNTNCSSCDTQVPEIEFFVAIVGTAPSFEFVERRLAFCELLERFS